LRLEKKEPRAGLRKISGKRHRKRTTRKKEKPPDKGRKGGRPLGKKRNLMGNSGIGELRYAHDDGKIRGGEADEKKGKRTPGLPSLHP